MGFNRRFYIVLNTSTVYRFIHIIHVRLIVNEDYLIMYYYNELVLIFIYESNKIISF